MDVREPLRLRQFPVVEILRVACDPRPAMRVQNGDAVTNQRATAETTPTALRLVRVASAALSTTDLLYVTYPTVAAGRCGQCVRQWLVGYSAK